MNFYDFHIGDYLTATAHLSMIEDAAYRRLIDAYYTREAPLPTDLKACYRLVRASSKAERDAVDVVLSEFFFLRDDGWHQERCDAAIARFTSGKPERELRKTNESNRVKRHREERAKLFEIITQAGEHVQWNTNINELRAIVKRLTETDQQPEPDTFHKPLPVTAPVTPATATHYPLPTTHYPLPSSKDVNPIAQLAVAPPGFGRFWEAWPKSSRKVDKAKCLKTWVREKLEHHADAITAHVQAMAQCEQWRKGFEPAPLTYLNGKRWLDPLPDQAYSPEQMAVIDGYNAALVDSGWPESIATPYSPQRALAIDEFIALGTREGWYVTYFGWLAKNLKAKPGFGFDWAIKRESVIRAREGNFAVMQEATA